MKKDTVEAKLELKNLDSNKTLDNLADDLRNLGLTTSYFIDKKKTVPNLLHIECSPDYFEHFFQTQLESEPVKDGHSTKNYKAKTPIKIPSTLRLYVSKVEIILKAVAY